MRVIGFDPSLSSTGWVVLEDNKILDFGLIKTAKTDTKRYSKIFFYIMELLKKYEPDEIHIETPFVGKNSRTAIELSRVQGGIFILSESMSINLVSFAPQEVKKQITGSGRGDKSEVAKKMIEILKDDIKIKEIGAFSDKSNKKKTSDIYDALAVAYVNKDE